MKMDIITIQVIVWNFRFFKSTHIQNTNNNVHTIYAIRIYWNWWFDIFNCHRNFEGTFSNWMQIKLFIHEKILVYHNRNGCSVHTYIALNILNIITNMCSTLIYVCILYTQYKCGMLMKYEQEHYIKSTYFLCSILWIKSYAFYKLHTYIKSTFKHFHWNFIQW